MIVVAILMVVADLYHVRAMQQSGWAPLQLDRAGCHKYS
jgi:hypothetical protein